MRKDFDSPLGLHPAQVAELETLRTALASDFITDWSIAIDGGAHLGGWTDILADHFKTVHAFEPARDTFAKLQANMAGRENVRLYNMALMQKRQLVAMQRRDKALTGRMIKPGGGDILACPIDDLDLQSCGFIKLDVEGCEFFALKGARRTLKRCRPFVMVEMDGRGERLDINDSMVADWLESMGYREVMRFGVDRGFAPE